MMTLHARLTTIVGTVLLILVTGAAHATDGGLGQWLRATAIPEITETLSRHPRFRGEPLEIGPLHAAAPTTQGNRLTRQIQQDVSQALLDVPGIVLRTGPGASKSCQAAGGVYLGIAIRPVHGNRYHVALRFLDRTEGVWITGVGAAWEGVLTSGQRTAWATADVDPRLQRTAPALHDSAAIAAQIAAQIDCQEQLARRLPDTPWQLAPSDDARLNAVAAELQRRAPQRFATASGATPLRLELDPAGSRLNLVAPNAALVSIDVRMSTAQRQPQRPQPLQPVTDVHVEAVAVAPTGVCRGAASRCIEVSLRTPDPAHTFAFLTFERGGEHRVKLLDCGATPPAARASRTLRIALDRDVDDAPLGVYALATRSPAMAAHIARELGSNCQRPAGADWIRQVDRLASHNEVVWHAQQVPAEPHAWAAAAHREY